MIAQSSIRLGKKLNPNDPDCHFLIYSDEFYDVLGCSPQFTKLVETDAHEGPVYVKNWNAVMFTTVPQSDVAIKKLSLNDKQVSVFREPSNMANGMTLDRQGRLLICEQGTKSTPARISRLDLNNPKLDLNNPECIET